jgi:hypothetical protein
VRVLPQNIIGSMRHSGAVIKMQSDDCKGQANSFEVHKIFIIRALNLKLMNNQVVFKAVMDVCATEWLNISEAPDYYTFRCLIKFQEHGLSGPSQPFISTGTWWHRDMVFSFDMQEYKHLTPMAFIPLYDGIKA